MRTDEICCKVPYLVAQLTLLRATEHILAMRWSCFQVGATSK